MKYNKNKIIEIKIQNRKITICIINKICLVYYILGLSDIGIYMYIQYTIILSKNVTHAFISSIVYCQFLINDSINLLSNF